MPPKRITIRDHTAEANLFARRSIIALMVVALMMFAVLSNLYYLQITSYEDYQTRSNGNRIKVLPVTPNRGLIYDRNGVLLAENRPIFSLRIIPEQVDDLKETLEYLKTLLNLEQSEIDDFYKEFRRQRRFKPVTLRNQLTQEEVALVSANQHRYPGVVVDARLTRYYPYANTLTHMLGYVAKINKKDLNKLKEAGQEANYAATYDIGKQGIEKFHEQLLHGKVGYQEVEVNNKGRVIRTLKFEPPTPGQDIALNIDIKLQKVAQGALEDKRGAIIALDPRDGGILALYSNPSYDPNLFVHGISSKSYSKLLNSKDRPLINRATQGQYPPASTIKPHLALLGLEENVIRPDTKMFDRGKYKLKNVEHEWRDWKPWGHGWMDVTSAIEQSCDTFFYDLSYKLGIDSISDEMHAFGFGEYSGIDLYEESDANMPSRGWKRARYNQPWYMGDTISVGIGQGYWTATPIQLAVSVATLVNRGERYVPQLLRGFYYEGQVQLAEPKSLQPLEVKNSENWDVVLDAMYGVVNREHGTAKKAFKDANYISAGKTGTAQVISIGQDEEYDAEKLAEHLRDNAMYVGYAPYENPEIVVVVALENAGHGGSQAAPIARKIMDYQFRDLPPLISEEPNSENSDTLANHTQQDRDSHGAE
ncbi:penicillin-binding protein 2 [Paraneptunicella aestuarii]|uniref:penicillin-binding protein 2 n=1 Tax=Paraneptunicella aestuarii TaxID=2831148 RepID=UPI001E42B31E|nr:penicillin-binding protein 2 [Paraneptunicella aestuarii]UAA39938.1 penicillin-binding protein 2 [Paraneptunicella aestuarii]